MTMTKRDELLALAEQRTVRCVTLAASKAYAEATNIQETAACRKEAAEWATIALALRAMED